LKSDSKAEHSDHWVQKLFVDYFLPEKPRDCDKNNAFGLEIVASVLLDTAAVRRHAINDSPWKKITG
jgi:hypothetical protein